MAMARVNAETPTKYTGPKVDQWGLDDAGTPYTTDATLALVGGRFVEDHPTIANTIRYASAQSITVRGLLLEDQQIQKAGNTIIADNKRLTYRIIGRGRARIAAPIPKHTWAVIAGNGDIRPFSVLAGDTPNMYVCRTTCGGTAIGAYVDVEVLVPLNGAQFP